MTASRPVPIRRVFLKPAWSSSIPLGPRCCGVITLHYKSDSLSRTLQVKAIAEDGDRSEGQGIKGSLKETIRLKAEIEVIKERNL